MRWYWPSTQILLVTSTCQTIIDDDNQLPNILLNYKRTVYFSNKIYHEAKTIDYYKVISTKVMAIWVAFFGHTSTLLIKIYCKYHDHDVKSLGAFFKCKIFAMMRIWEYRCKDALYKTEYLVTMTCQCHPFGQKICGYWDAVCNNNEIHSKVRRDKGKGRVKCRSCDHK